jgi:AcrR family transcriptional regulator
MPKKTTQRRRLSPKDRIDELLDTAGSIVKSEGVAAATMQRIAQDSGVSKGLIYAYFDDQSEMLQALMFREYKRFKAIRERDAREATSFDEMVRATQMDSLDYALNRRPFRDRLMAVPAVSEAMKETLAKERRNDVNFLSKKILENFNIPRAIARLAIVQLTGIRKKDFSGPLSKAKMKEIEDIWSTMVNGAFEALEKKYGK